MNKEHETTEQMEDEMMHTAEHASRVYRSVAPDRALLERVLNRMQSEGFARGEHHLHAATLTSIKSPYSVLDRLSALRIAMPAFVVLLLVGVAVFETTKNPDPMNFATQAVLPYDQTELGIESNSFAMDSGAGNPSLMMSAEPAMMAMSAKMAPVVLPPSGDPVMIVDAVISESDNDSALMSDMSYDIEFVSGDTQVINDLANAYDEQAF